MEPSAYLHLEGALIYLTKSRPDIHTAVSFGATQSVTLEELMPSLKYLEATREEGSVLKAGEPHGELVFRCYVDASYLTHSDSKSHQGYCMSFGEIGTFYNKSSKQLARVAYVCPIWACSTLVVDIIFIVELCKELARPIKLPVIVFEDNGAVIVISSIFQTRRMLPTCSLR